MPFYEYECPHCRYYAEVMQKISDAPLKKCPSCGKGGFKKLISAPVFRLKGSGWYETDFKSNQEDKRNLAGADKDESPQTEAKTEAKAEDKAEAKVEGKGEAKSDVKAEGKSAEKSETKPAASGSSGGGARSPARRNSPRAAKRAPARRAGKAARRGQRG